MIRNRSISGLPKTVGGSLRAATLGDLYVGLRSICPRIAEIARKLVDNFLHQFGFHPFQLSASQNGGPPLSVVEKYMSSREIDSLENQQGNINLWVSLFEVNEKEHRNLDCEFVFVRGVP